MDESSPHLGFLCVYEHSFFKYQHSMKRLIKQRYYMRRLSNETIYCCRLVLKPRLMLLNVFNDQASFFIYFRPFTVIVILRQTGNQRDPNSDRRSRRNTCWPQDPHLRPWYKCLIPHNELSGSQFARLNNEPIGSSPSTCLAQTLVKIWCNFKSP